MSNVLDLERVYFDLFEILNFLFINFIFKGLPSMIYIPQCAYLMSTNRIPETPMRICSNHRFWQEINNRIVLCWFNFFSGIRNNEGPCTSVKLTRNIKRMILGSFSPGSERYNIVYDRLNLFHGFHHPNRKAPRTLHPIRSKKLNFWSVDEWHAHG